MFKSKRFLHKISKELILMRQCSSSTSGISSRGNRKFDQSKLYTPNNFKLQRALIVTKLSRYEFEQLRHPTLNKDQLEHKIRHRGTDYEALIYLHHLHKEFEKKVVNSFIDAGCEVKVTNRVEFRSTLSKDIMKWADLIVPVGGDGTFLLAAGRASPLFAQSQHKTPIMGFNSDPERSEGRLMLPKHYAEDPADAVAKVKSGCFEWMHRTRIRTSILTNGHAKFPECIDLYRHKVSKMEQEPCDPQPLSEWMAKKYKAKMKRVLPYLALNEVFIGENLSARVSHLQMVINHGDTLNKTKCSGLCVSTGTGSTSWHMSINRVTEKHVTNLLRMLPNVTESNLDKIDYAKICLDFNQNLRFPPDDARLCYTVREQICVGVWPSPKDFKDSDFVRTLYVNSRCIDASLVIDGSISYPFNDGSKTLLEVHPEDALLTVSLP